MTDGEVIQAFLDGVGDAYGPTLHLEGDALYLAGWWHTALRIGPNTFIVRDEIAPDGSRVLEELQRALHARGLREIAGDHPVIYAITYAEISLAAAEWKLYAPNEMEGELAVATRAGAESMPRDWTADDAGFSGELGPHLEGARRIAGLPPSVVVAVGLPTDASRALEAAIPECRFEVRSLEEIAPEACGDLGPTAIVVDARTTAGRHFIMELRAAACGRFLPVAAVVEGATPPAGADIALDPSLPPPAWRADIMALLP